MALTCTKKDKIYFNGMLLEIGTWSSDGGTTTGTFTCDTTTGEPQVVEIYNLAFSSDGDHAVKTHTLSRVTQTITYTAADTGKYFCLGRVG